MTRRAIFFDRDGVLVVPEERDGRTFAVTRLEDFRLYADTSEALRLSHESGFLNVVVTNQPDVASGQVLQSVVEEMHQVLCRSAIIDRVEVSYDPSGSDAPRRKPNPGMILDAASALGVDTTASFMIGDRAIDMEAGPRAGCTKVFIDRGYTKDPLPSSFDHKVTSVLDAVLWCIGRTNTNRNA
ncbi:MAG: HAD-IIIA family hydrolase [Actinomycetota bacterium]